MGRESIRKELWLGPLSLDTKALESCLGHTLAGPVGLSCTKLIMRILTHPIFRLLSYIWKMKMPSKSDYFFPARFRHFHHGRGYQLKARGLLVEKREQKSWLIQCQCHRAIEACDMPFTCPWTGTSLLAGSSAHFPLAHGRDTSLDEMLFKFPRLSDITTSLCLYVLTTCQMFMILIYLVMIISPKLEIISLRRKSSTFDTILAATPVLAPIEVCEYGVTLLWDNQVLAWPQLGSASGWRYNCNNNRFLQASVCVSPWICGLWAEWREKKHVEVRGMEGKCGEGKGCDGIWQTPAPPTKKPFIPGTLLSSLGFWGEGLKAWADEANFCGVFLGGGPKGK